MLAGRLPAGSVSSRRPVLRASTNARTASSTRSLSMRLLQVAFPEIEQPGPCLFRSDRVIVRARHEQIPMVRVWNDLQQVFRLRLRQGTLELRYHMRRHGRIGLGEPDVELAGDLVQQPVL